MRIDSFAGPYRFLSNFYPVGIEFEGIVFPSVEHAFQAAKTLSKAKRLRISQCVSPAIAKRIGRQVDLRHDWDNIRLSIMDELIEIKFQVPELAIKLLDTDGAVLVEGNYWHDDFWGDCTCPTHWRKQGANHLGKILMSRRDALARLYEEVN